MRFDIRRGGTEDEDRRHYSEQKASRSIIGTRGQFRHYNCSGPRVRRRPRQVISLSGAAAVQNKNPFCRRGQDSYEIPLSCRNHFLPELAPSPSTKDWLPGFTGPCPSTSLDKVPSIQLLTLSLPDFSLVVKCFD